MPSQFTLESDVEDSALDWLQSLGYTYLDDAAANAEREFDQHEVLLKQRVLTALRLLNPGYDSDVYQEAYRQLIRLADNPDLMSNNHNFHKKLVEGIKIPRSVNGESKTFTLYPIDFNNLDRNDYVVTNQFTVLQGDHNRRPDITIFINGLPVVTFELKNLANEETGIANAFNQFQTYKREISDYMQYNEILIISDGIDARVGSLTAGEDRFMGWRLPDEISGKAKPLLALESLIRGMLPHDVLLNLIRNFIIFEMDGDKTIKILAAYHQYYMVNKAVNRAHKAINTPDDNRIGVVWHTQGSGKSLSMVFFAGIASRNLNNPTIVVINDRNDLDDQLSGTFAAASEFLGQVPKQANSRDEMRKLLATEAGGIVFTTIQKFSPEFENGETEMPVLTDCSNVIVVADEAHRTQYGLSARYSDDGGVKYGYAKYLRDALPNASFIGFTGTPISKTDKNTAAVFGDYIDIYDMAQAVADHATVKIFYESHTIPLSADDGALDALMQEAENYDVFVDEDTPEMTKSRQEYTRIEALAGAKPRVERLATEFIKHFETRQGQEFGKAMIVAMSRRNAVAIYNAIVAQRPTWGATEVDKGRIKVVMTGSAADPEEMQPHIGNKQYRKQLERRMKDLNDELQIVIVVDMWLTGFDVPSMNTMYIDKPMKEHNLMQAIARVNRVFRDKDGGLVVDFIGIADNLKQALQQYTPNDQKQVDINEGTAIKLMMEKYEIIKNDFMYGIDYRGYNSTDRETRMNAFRNTWNELEGLDKDEKRTFIDVVTQLTRAFALVATSHEAQVINDEVAFFKAIKSAMIKMTVIGGASQKEIDLRMRQILDKSVVTGEVVDLYADLGIEKPDISILSDAFLKEVENMPQKNLALSLLEQLLNGQVKSLARSNLTKANSFKELLEKSIENYNKRGVTTEIVIRELIELANQITAARNAGQELGLSPEEVAFYDALSNHDKAVQELGEEKLHELARRLVDEVRKNLGTDWSARESTRAQMRVAVKRLLRQFGYPPDFAAEAIDTVVTQAETMAFRESGQ